MRVALAVGEDRTGVDIRVEPMAVGRVEGRLEGSLEGLAGGRLRLLHAGDIDSGFDYETATAVVHGDGTLAFPSVPVGQYLIEALPSQTDIAFNIEAISTTRGLAPAMYDPDPVRPGGGSMLPSETGTVWLRDDRRLVGGWVREAAEVVAGRAERVVVAVRPTVSLSGRVVLEEKPSSAAGADDLVAFAFLRAEPSDPSFGLAAARVDSKMPDSFAVSGLLPGAYYLTRLIGDLNVWPW